jgi:NAD(P)-dependent dehydrogenase (short-subunit alcohol dehydrogenase family)
VVTGGGSGLGRAFCLELGRQGAIVTVTDSNPESGEQVATSINAAGGKAHFQRVDVSRADEVQSLIDATVSRHGRIDYLFNNAGFALAGDVRDIGLDDWRRIIDVNLTGVVYGTVAAYPHMVRQGSGHIVNIASLAGLIGSPILTPYVTTKFAVVGLSMNLREEGAPHGVKISVVCPGFVETRIFDDAKIIRVSKNEIKALVTFKMMSADDAARATLRGVARNQDRIVFPGYAKILWWLYRWSPALLKPFGQKTIRDFGKMRERASR